MHNAKIVKLILYVSLLLFFACATASRQKEGTAATAENKESDISKLQKAVDKNPKNTKALLELGLAWYEKREFQTAIATLNKVLAIEPNNGKALFYAGTAYEINGDLDNAMEMYKKYNRVNKSSDLRTALEKRLKKLVQLQMQKEIKQTIKDEEKLDATQIPQNSIAVVNFKYMGKDDNLQPLQKGLADLLITDLSKVEKLTVIERLKMQALLSEMGLGMTGLVDARTAPRVGKLLGSAKLINGAYINLEKDQFRIDAGITETASGKFKASDVTGKMNNFFKLEKDLVFNLIKTMGYKLSQQEIDNIRIVPTENLLAFMAYCNALDYTDRGKYDEASQEYLKALQLDPKFELAKQKNQQLSGMSEKLQPMNQLVDIAKAEFEPQTSEVATKTIPAQQPKTTPVAEKSISANAAGTFTSTTPASGLSEPTFIDRLQTTGQIIDFGFIPGVESREPVQEQSQPTFGNTANIEISVPIH